MEDHIRRLQASSGRAQGSRLRPSQSLGARNMPQWVSSTFVHPSVAPPPPPSESPPGHRPQPNYRENDYEEIGPAHRLPPGQQQQRTLQLQQQQQQQQQQRQQQQRQQLSASMHQINSRQMAGRQGGSGVQERVHCDLCGSPASAVRCDKCNGQVFCLSCDDMYHRHPKRSAHVRKAVDSVQRPFRPPLPPKAELHNPPVPPPRRNKRFGLFGSKKEQSPALPRKENTSGVMGSLKRFMGVRPLPPPPTQKGGLSSVWEEPGAGPPPPPPSQTRLQSQRSPSQCSADSGRPPSDDTNAALPATITDMSSAGRHQRQMSAGRAELPQDHGDTIRPRSQSVSGHMSPQPWAYQPEAVSPQHNMLQGFVTTRRGQSYRGWQQPMGAGSVCDIPSMPMHHPHHHHPPPPAFMPHMMHAQSMAQLGCPTCHHPAPGMWYPAEQAGNGMVSYPSNTSLSGGYPAGGGFTSSRDLRHPSPAPSGRSMGRTAPRARRLARSQMELSRFPSDSDDYISGAESDDESERPVDEGVVCRPATPTTAWHCQHCTFQNAAGTRVCAMCCRTQPPPPPRQTQQRKRRRRRLLRGSMPPGSPAPPSLGRDPSPGGISRGRESSSSRREPSPGGISRGRDPSPADISRGRDPAAEVTEKMAAVKMNPAEGRDPRAPDEASHESSTSDAATEVSQIMTSSVTSPKKAAAPGTGKEPKSVSSQQNKQTTSTGTSPPPQTIATQTNEDQEVYHSRSSLPRAISRGSLAGDYEPFRYSIHQRPNLKRTQSFQAFSHHEREDRTDPWFSSFGPIGSRYQGRSNSKSSVQSTISDSRAFAAYASGASSRGESPARYAAPSDRSPKYSYSGDSARKPADGSDYLVGLEELMMKKRRDSAHNQGMELVLMLRDAEKHNFSPEDLQIALNHCGERAPVPWLLDNLESMLETVCTLATNYGHERKQNDVGTISNKEARDALRLHKGNVWTAVTECVEQRRKKYSQLAGRGTFPREDIVTALTANHGNVEAAYLDLNRTQLKPFLMRIWGPPQGVEVTEGAPVVTPAVSTEVSQSPAKTTAASAASSTAAEGAATTTTATTSGEAVLAAAKTENDTTKSKDFITPPSSPPPAHHYPRIATQPLTSHPGPHHQSISPHLSAEPVSSLASGSAASSPTSTVTSSPTSSSPLQKAASLTTYASPDRTQSSIQNVSTEPHRETHVSLEPVSTASISVDTNTETASAAGAEPGVVNRNLKPVPKPDQQQLQSLAAGGSAAEDASTYSRVRLRRSVTPQPKITSGDGLKEERQSAQASALEPISTVQNVAVPKTVPTSSAAATAVPLSETEDATDQSHLKDTTQAGKAQAKATSSSATTRADPVPSTRGVFTSAKGTTTLQESQTQSAKTKSAAAAAEISARESSSSPFSSSASSRDSLVMMTPENQLPRALDRNSSQDSTQSEGSQRADTKFRGVTVETGPADNNGEVASARVGVSSNSDSESSQRTGSSASPISIRTTASQLTSAARELGAIAKQASMTAAKLHKTAMSKSKRDPSGKTTSPARSKGKSSRTTQNEEDVFQTPKPISKAALSEAASADASGTYATPVPRARVKNTHSDPPASHVVQLELDPKDAGLAGSSIRISTTATGSGTDTEEYITSTEIPQTYAIPTNKPVHGSGTVSHPKSDKDFKTPAKPCAASAAPQQLDNDITYELAPPPRVFPSANSARDASEPNSVAISRPPPEGAAADETVKHTAGAEDELSDNAADDDEEMKRDLGTATPISQRLEKARRVISTHVLRQQTGLLSVEVTAEQSDTGSEMQNSAEVDAEQGEDDADYANVYAAANPNVMHSEKRAGGNVTGSKRRGSEEGATSDGAVGDNVVSTSSDSVSEGYEAVVDVKFQPGGKLSGQASLQRLQKTTSSSTESLTQSYEPVTVVSAPARQKPAQQQSALATHGNPLAAQQAASGSAPSSDTNSGAAAASVTAESVQTHSDPATDPDTASTEGSIALDSSSQAATLSEPTASSDREQSENEGSALSATHTEPHRNSAPPQASARAESPLASTAASTSRPSSAAESFVSAADVPRPSSALESPMASAPASVSRPSSVADAGGHSSGVSDNDSSDEEEPDSGSDARPSDVAVAALKEDLRSGSAALLRRTASDRHKVQRRASRLLRQGRARSQVEAELASQLMSLQFPATDSLQAAEECSSLYTALSFLHQECELCAGRCSVNQMISMTHCTHRCCRGCAEAYFTQRIKERPLTDLRCPFCNEPDLLSEEVASDYFSHLDIMLKSLVPSEVHGLFHKKLFDRAMMKDPNFKWCPKCSSGFIAQPRQKKLTCPDCGTISCALCSKTLTRTYHGQWATQHDGVSCEVFADWQRTDDPNYQSLGLERHLATNGISCPSCKFRYALAKGGCMHFTCTQCKYEFCSGCGRPFNMGSKCGTTDYCSRLGLHAHHPRNCLFYLRDREPKELQQLLKDNNVEFNTEPPSSAEVADDATARRCRVQEQKETPQGLKDDLCGRTVFPNHAGLCRMHYVEYLAGLVWNRHIDPVTISDISDLRQEMRRHGKRVRIQRVRESDEKYAAALRKLVQEELPLDA